MCRTTRRAENCCVIEFNSFGAWSGCGSCLFHWPRDRDVLYGGAAKDVGGGSAAVEFSDVNLMPWTPQRFARAEG